MNTLFSELRRRHVFKVAAAYGVVAWLVIQAASIVFPAFGAPDWVLRVVITLAVLGFPIALVLAWAFELTPEGVRRADPLGAAEEPSRRHRRALDSRAAGWVGVGILVGLTTVGTYGWLRMPDSAGDAEAGAIRSMAVLPFVNVSGDTESEYFSDGITEEILNALSQVPELRVAARTSAFSFKGSQAPIDSIARSLQVAHVLEGSVRIAGDRVRIRAQLVHPETGHQLWSYTYNRELKDIFAVQEEIAVAIANALQVKLAGGDATRLPRSRTPNPEAYELYLQGRHLANKRTKEDLTQAIGRFEAALVRDPAFAAAYSGLADAYALLEDHGGVPRAEAFPKAIAAAKRALELDELQAEAHASLGHIYYHQRNWAAAEKEYQRAIELNPSYATAYHWYGILLRATNRLPEAVQALDRAYELDPLSPKIGEVRGRIMYNARQFDQAIAWFRELLRAEPDNPDLVYHLGRTYLAAGRHAEAIASMQRRIELVPVGRPNGWVRAQLAAAYAAAGRSEEAVRIVRELEREGVRDHGAEAEIAIAYGFLGDRDQAFHWIDVMLEQGDWMLDMLEHDPAFDPLRPDPRFARVLERVEQRARAGL